MAAARQAASWLRSVALARPVARRRGPLRIVGGLLRRFSARDAPSRLRSAPSPRRLSWHAQPRPRPPGVPARLQLAVPHPAHPAARLPSSTADLPVLFTCASICGHTSRMHSSPPRRTILRATAARTLLLRPSATWPRVMAGPRRRDAVARRARVTLPRTRTTTLLPLAATSERQLAAATCACAVTVVPGARRIARAARASYEAAD